MTFFQESLFWDCTCALKCQTKQDLFTLNGHDIFSKNIFPILFTSIFKYDNKLPGRHEKWQTRRTVLYVQNELADRRNQLKE